MTKRRETPLVPVLCLLIAGLLGSSEALAQHGASGEEEAVRLFQQSVEEYRAGRFQNAVDLLRRAYELHPEPTLLYNLGRALEGLGDEQGAIDGYSRYLEAQPNAADRGALEHRIETLRQRLHEREALNAERERDREREEREQEQQEQHRAAGETSHEGGSSGPGALPWIVAGVGGAALAAGGVMGVLAQGKADDADAAVTQTDVHDQYDSARTSATVANVCFIAGGVIAAIGLAWGIIGNLGGGEEDEEYLQDDDSGDVRASSPRVAWVPPGGLVVTW